jgi:flagellar basal body rod protein FlgB
MFAAIVKVISLKCVQQRTNPKKVTACKIKNVNTPLFQAISCSYSKAFIYNFLKRCNQEKINNKSTPLSCTQKKSSVYKSSRSSSSRTIGIIIGSGTRENDNIVPLTN